MLPADRLVVVFLGPHAKGEQFRDWPLHITIVPWFRNELSAEDIARQLAAELRAIMPFVATVGESTQFGYKGRKTVELIQTPTPLVTVEKIVRRFLKSQQSWIVDETTKKRLAFRPHVTRQGEMRTQKSGQIPIESISIVEQHGGYKEVVGVVNLGKQQEGS
jgi:2'-5' RNA ligase